MKYRFNYEKWYNNNAKIVEKSIELNAFQFERFYYEDPQNQNRPTDQL